MLKVCLKSQEICSIWEVATVLNAFKIKICNKNMSENMKVPAIVDRKRVSEIFFNLYVADAHMVCSVRFV